MPGSISWRKFIQRLRQLGFVGPYASGRHLFMRKSNMRLIVPNPHGGDISIGLVVRILRQAGIDFKQWDELD